MKQKPTPSFPKKQSHYEKRKSINRSSPMDSSIATFLHEIIPEINQLLENIINNQVRKVKLNERMAETELKKAKAASDLTEVLKSEEFLDSLARPKKKKKNSVKRMDKKRNKVIQMIIKRRNKGDTFQKIAMYLKKEKIPTFSGRGEWHAQTIHRLFLEEIFP